MLRTKMINIAALTMAVVLGTGCAVNRATAKLAPDADLAKVHSIYIEKQPKDNRNIDQLLKKSLEQRGYSVTTGTSSKPNGPADAALSYVDRWMWDITMYMLELTVNLREPNTNTPIATGNSYHTSLTRKSPQEMADEVVGNIFDTRKK
jgi:hypothetical protein